MSLWNVGDSLEPHHGVSTFSKWSSISISPSSMSMKGGFLNVQSNDSSVMILWNGPFANKISSQSEYSNDTEVCWSLFLGVECQYVLLLESCGNEFFSRPPPLRHVEEVNYYLFLLCFVWSDGWGKCIHFWGFINLLCFSVHFSILCICLYDGSHRIKID